MKRNDPTGKYWDTVLDGGAIGSGGFNYFVGHMVQGYGDLTGDEEFSSAGKIMREDAVKSVAFNGAALMVPFVSGSTLKAGKGLSKIDPKKIKFTQDSISKKFKNKIYGTVDDLANALKGGKINPEDIKPIRVVDIDGGLYSLDNRRLKAFQDAGIDIPFKQIDNIPKNEAFKFTTKNNGKSIKVRD